MVLCDFLTQYMTEHQNKKGGSRDIEFKEPKIDHINIDTIASPRNKETMHSIFFPYVYNIVAIFVSLGFCKTMRRTDTNMQTFVYNKIHPIVVIEKMGRISNMETNRTQ